MASYVIHDIAGEVLLKKLKEVLDIDLTEEERNHFFMGNLIPDSSKLQFPALSPDLSSDELKSIKRQRSSIIQREKQATHFRLSSDLDKNIQVPELEMFLVKYADLLSSDISVLGYLFHLYTDKLFFGDLFNKTLTFLDSSKNKTNLMAESKTVILKKDNKEYDCLSVFSHDGDVSIYKDYTTMNSLLLAKYNIEFPYASLVASVSTFSNPGIEEVDYNNITGVLSKTSQYIEESKQLHDYSLQVFKDTDVEDFTNDVVSSFITLYRKEILASTKSLEKAYVPKKKPIS